MEFITTGNRIAVENFSIGKIYTIIWATGNYKSLACVGKGSDFVMFQDQAPDLLFCLTMDTAIAVESIEEGGGGAGTMNYNELDNKPSINGIVLVGNKTGADLNLVSQADLDDYATNASVVAGLATKQDALSSSQLAAVNSGITSALVTQIGSNTTAIAGKQDALSSSQLAAVNSGIDSTKVAQIETNKNNISSVQAQADWNSATGVTNLFDFDKWKQGLTAMRGTVSISENSVTVQATSNDAYTKTDTLSISVMPNTKYILTWNTTATTDHNGTAYIFPNVSTFKYTISTNERLEFTTGSGDTSITIRFGVDTSGDSITYSNIMLRSGTITDNTYQPYALSNAELTAAEKQNETNILYSYSALTSDLLNVSDKTMTATGFVFQETPVSLKANTEYIFYVTIDSKAPMNLVGYTTGQGGRTVDISVTTTLQEIGINAIKFTPTANVDSMSLYINYQSTDITYSGMRITQNFSNIHLIQ